MIEPERLTRLEERYAHLQRHVAEQDKAMLVLTEELDQLRKEVGRLRAQSGAPGGTENEAGDERPPHY